MIDVEIAGLEKIKELTGNELVKVISDDVPESTKQQLKQRYKVKSVSYKDSSEDEMLIVIMDSETTDLLKIVANTPYNPSDHSIDSDELSDELSGEL